MPISTGKFLRLDINGWTKILLSLAVYVLMFAVAFGVLRNEVSRNRADISRIENQTQVQLQRLDDKISQILILLREP